VGGATAGFVALLVGLKALGIGLFHISPGSGQ
jgi:hypothetical protein